MARRVGLKSVKAGDMVTVPDLSTGFIDPFLGCAHSQLYWLYTGGGYKAIFFSDPRNIARRAEEYLVESGIADQSRWGPEFEFYVFDTRRL